MASIKIPPMVFVWLILALNFSVASFASPIRISNFLNAQVSPYLAKNENFWTLLENPIDPRGKNTTWDFRLFFDPQTLQYSPSQVLNAE